MIVLFIEISCPVCTAGPIGFRLCDDGSLVVIMCDECHAVWTRPDRLTSEAAMFPHHPDYTIPGTDRSVSGGKAGWATRDQIATVGWEDLIAGNQAT